MSGKKNFLPEKINSSKGNYTIDGTVCSLRNSVSAMPFPFLAFVAFGTRKGLLRYGIDTRCQKRHPTPRFSIFCTKKSVSQPWALRDGRDDAWSA